MKEKILELKNQGLSYNKISRVLKCSKGIISYYCGINQREKSRGRSTERKYKIKKEAVKYKGGKCEKCGYCKCMSALEFHHLDPNEKDFNIAKMRGNKLETLIPELDKCILLCANCHREVHAGIQ